MLCEHVERFVSRDDALERASRKAAAASGSGLHTIVRSTEAIYE